MSADDPETHTTPTPTPSAEPHEPDADIVGIAALGDPLRRALYRFVVAQREPVNRDQAAEGAGVARHVARFHLDRLVDDGLLRVEYARPPGRRGPGAGRPAKHYARADRELSVSLPPRHYELAGRLLARAVSSADRDGVAVGEALAQAAHDAGVALGRRAADTAGPRPSPSTRRAAAVAVLEEAGYEPRLDGAEITLVNCPFHALAEEYTDLVCGMNLDLLSGLADALGDARLQARLEPAPDRCCVRFAVTDG